MTEPWRIRLLGGLGAFQGDREITRFRTQKTGLLLAYLAFYGGRDHARDVLLETLWPESDLSAARNSLSVALNSLRKQLEPPITPGSAATGAVVIADRTLVRLRDEAFATDVAAFEAAREAAAQTMDADPAAIEHLIAAVGHYTGEFLPGFYDDWVLSARERLADARLQTLRRLAALLMQARDFDRALDFAHQAVEADPLGETSRRLLMRLYAAVGRPAAVRETLQELERLREEQGEDPPTAATNELALRLSEGTDKESDIPLPAPATKRKREALGSSGQTSADLLPAAPSRTSVEPVGVPLQFTRFFGRTEELEKLGEWMASEARLITLTGPGGAGKTRCAIEVANRVSDPFPGGIFFVPLADIVEPGRIMDAIRTALRLSPSPRMTSLEQIIERLGDKPALLILDNLEHLLGHGPLDTGGAAAAVRTLLQRIPSVKILATSRQRLGLENEQEFALPPLSVPPDPHLPPETLLQSASVQLFADRARARRVDFQVTPHNAEATARLCARLEGIPLAIELAAAWAKLVTPSQMLRRLNEGLDILESRRPDLPERQRSLRGAVAWSCSLLPPDVVQLFYRLSVFRGGATLEAIEAVCKSTEEPMQQGVALDALTRLRDASLLIADTATAGPEEEMRLRLLEPLREYAAEQLDSKERDTREERHAAYFLQCAETASTQLQGPEQAAWFDRLEADHENFRTALTRTVTTFDGLRMVAALGWFWKTRGHLREGSVWLERALVGNAGLAPSPERAKAQSVAGTLAYDLGDFDTAQRFYEDSLATSRTLESPRLTAIAFGNLGNVAYRRGENALARQHYTENLAIHRELDDTLAIAGALGNLGNVAQSERDFAESLRLQEESLALSRRLGDSRMTSYTLHNLGNLASLQEDWEKANRFYAESLPLKQTLGDRRGVSSIHTSLGYLLIRQSQFAEAREHFVASLQISRSIGDKLGLLNALEGVAWIALEDDEALQAARLLAATHAQREALSAPHQAEDAEQFETLRGRARALLTPAEFNTARAIGSAWTLEEATDSAMG